MDASQQKILEAAERCIPFYTEQLNQRRRMLNETVVGKQMLLKLNPNSDVTDLEEAEKQLHFNSLLNIALIELLVIMKHLMLSTNEWEKAYFLKHSYMIVHETIGRCDRYNRELNKFKNQYPELKPLYEKVSADLKLFKKTYDYPSAFSAVRNAIVAHIDPDIGVYYDAVAALDGDKVLAIINSFSSILMDFLQFSVQIAALETKRMDDQGINIDQQIEDLKAKIDQLFANAAKGILPK